MLAQVKKLAGGDLAGRLSAWWDGREYVAPSREPEAEAAPADAPAPAPQNAPATDPGTETVAEAEAGIPAADSVTAAGAAAGSGLAAIAGGKASEGLKGAEARLRALATLWGERRLAPGSSDLDRRLIDAALELADRPGDIGFIGCDGALLAAFTAVSERQMRVAEWRGQAVARMLAEQPKASVSESEVDRPRGFSEGLLVSVISIEALAFSDHKAGLVSRVFRALDASGRWVFLDTTRTTKKTPPAAFASAWAEPQLASDEEIEELLRLGGFRTVRKVSANNLVLGSARRGYASLAQVLEEGARSGLAGREGALFLQELAWEAQSWRARSRAIEGGALDINIWVADKTEQTAPLSIMLDHVAPADDAGLSQVLFAPD
jgi:hypothetical protein